MKKFYLSTLIAVLIMAFSLHSNGQQLAIKGGLNLANMNFDYDEIDEPETKFTAGFNLGLELFYPLQSGLSLQTGLGISQAGYAMDVEETIENFDDDFDADGYAREKYTYFKIPVNISFKTQNFRIFGGPYLEFGLTGIRKSDYTLYYQGEEESYEEDVDLKPAFGTVEPEDLDDDEEAFNGIDGGVNFGIGYDIGDVGISASFSKGLSNVIPKMEDEGGNNNSDYRDDNSVTNTVLQFSVSYAISSL